MNEALRDWVANVESTFYIIGTVAGPHPYPAMVRDFQSVIGNEVREQMMEAEGRLPGQPGGLHRRRFQRHGPVPPVPRRQGGADLRRRSRRQRGRDRRARGIAHRRQPGVLHGNRTYLLQNEDGQITEAHSISAGLDYPGIGPEHAWLRDTGRVSYVSATDKEALEAFQLCTRLEGIIPALEPSHALSYVSKIAPDLPSDHLLVMNMCGRGDKDVFAVAEHLGVEM